MDEGECAPETRTEHSATETNGETPQKAAEASCEEETKKRSIVNSDEGKEQKPCKIPKAEATDTNDAEKSASEGLSGGALTQVPKQKLKKRKIALFLAYCGVGYQGMQRNPGAKTIEGDLEEALFKAGAIANDMFGDPRKVDWMRSARTDKGVSAVGQVVSGWFIVDPPGLVERVNSHLPEQIRVFGYKRVTPTFSAKKFCDRRRYEYVLPLFALDPSAHRDRESVLEAKESGLVKCVECSERGRKVPGLVGRRTEDGKIINEMMPDFSGLQGERKETSAPVSVQSSEPENITENVSSMSESRVVESTNGELSSCSLVCEGNVKEGVGNENPVKNSKSKDGSPLERRCFRYGSKERERFNRILNHFVGTRNFHNFTSRTRAEDPAANRYILSFEASDVFTIDGMDFVKCTVVGQSFMLHQIRKMVGLAVAVMRNSAPESVIPKALRKDINMNIPTAPELGLFLDECLFPAYNQRWQNSHEEISLKGFEKEVADFKQKNVYSHIASMEVKEGVVALWLHSLNQRNYSDFAVAWEEEKLQALAKEAAPKGDGSAT